MPEKDYYKILGVDRKAAKEDLKKAYKVLAKKYHPDVSKEPGAEAKFKEASEAFRVLMDDKARAHYDKFGSADFQNMQYSNFDFDFEGFDLDLGDIFEGFFGAGAGSSRKGRGRGGPLRGNDLQYNLEINLEEAAFGVEKTFSVAKMDPCEKCDGKGTEDESNMKKCPECNGAGYVKRVQNTPFGISLSTTTPCRRCGAAGVIIDKPCKKCHGQGRMQVTKKLTVRIPAGIESGSTMRVDREGEAPGKGGVSGDLYVRVLVKPHDVFVRDGNDIVCEVPISFVTAALGGEIEVPTLKGTAELKIPEGTQTNTVFRMRGKGIPHLNRYAVGDQNVKVIVQTPEHLNKKQREILREFEKEGGSRLEKRGFFSRIRDAI